MKRLRKYKFQLLAVLFLLLVLFGYPLWKRIQGQIALARYKQALRARGEALTVEEVLASLPADTNALILSPEEFVALANPAAQLARKIQESEVKPENPPGRERAAAVTALLQTFPKLRSRLTNQTIHVLPNYSVGYAEILLPHLGPLKSAIGAAKIAAEEHLKQGRLDEALADVEAGSALAHVLDREPILISQLLKIACEAILLDAVRDAIQTPGWTDAQLARLQLLLRNQEVVASALKAMEMERAWDLDLFPEGSHPLKDADLNDLLFWEEDDSDLFMEALSVLRRLALPLNKWKWKHIWHFEEELFILQYYDRALDDYKKFLSRKSLAAVLTLQNGEWTWPAKDVFFTRARAHKFRWAVVPMVLIDTEGLLRKVAMIQTLIEIGKTAVALERFRLRHGRYPKSLRKLIPDFLPALPTDWIDGEPLRYRLDNPGRCRLWSIGLDGADDDGKGKPNFSSRRNNQETQDVVWILGKDRP